MSKSYIVEGMTCGHCAQSVTNAVKSLKDGLDVTIDLGAKTVTVQGDVEEDAVREAVEDAGFDFKGSAQ